MCGWEVKGSAFFFEKKNQKTFPTGTCARRLARAPVGKVFLLLFLQKKKVLASFTP
jgi:hypothetical protein